MALAFIAFGCWFSTTRGQFSSPELTGGGCLWYATVFPSVLSLLSMWGVRIGFGYVLCFSPGLDIEGLWIAMWAEWAVRMAALSIRLLRGSWWKGEKKEISVKENTL